MITDGKPSCLKEPDGYYKNSWDLDLYITGKCHNLARQCRKLGIPITTFMIATTPFQQFVSDFTEANNGRAFFTGLQGLGDTIFADFERNRRGRARPDPRTIPTSRPLAPCALPATRRGPFPRRSGPTSLTGFSPALPLFEGIVGYDDTVLPDVQRALLAGHSMNLLGLRGQAKTRIARGLTDLLDEWVPVLPGSHRCRRTPWRPSPNKAAPCSRKAGTTRPSRGCIAASATWRSSPRRM